MSIPRIRLTIEKYKNPFLLIEYIPHHSRIILVPIRVQFLADELKGFILIIIEQERWISINGFGKIVFSNQISQVLNVIASVPSNIIL